MNFEQQRSLRRFWAWGLLVAIIALPTIIAFSPLVAAIGHVIQGALDALVQIDFRIVATVFFGSIILILAIIVRNSYPPAPHDDPRDDS